MSTGDNSTGIWMPLYIGDYLANTSRLNTLQHGALLLLLMDYWRNGHLPDDDMVLAQITRLPSDAWSMHRAVLEHFFSVESGRWVNAELDAELARAKEKRKKAVAKAKAAANAMHAKRKAQSVQSSEHACSSDQAEPEHCPSPSPSEEKHITPTAGDSSPEMRCSPSIWDLWVQITGDQKSRPFLGKQIKEHGEPAVRRAVLETINKQPADPNSYLLGVLRDRKTSSVLSAAERVERANADLLLIDGTDKFVTHGEGTHDRYRS